MQMATTSSVSGRRYQVGYNTETRILRIRYPDFKTYECLATPEEFANLMAAPSKGQWINANLQSRLIAAGGLVPDPKPFLVGEQTCGLPIKLREPERTKVLQTFNADDKCCSGPLAQAIESGLLENAERYNCPICGCEYRPEIVGAVRHWRYFEDCAILRL